MIDEYIRQLESLDPVQRRAAILAVGKAGDPRALPSLLKIYKTDPDPVLRELALRAGRHIRDLQSQVAQGHPIPPSQPVPQPVKPSPMPLSSAPFVPPPPAPLSPAPPFTELSNLAPAPLAPVRKLPSEREKALAKGRLDQAIGQKLQGQNDKALDSLAEAVRLDPDLAAETVALNLAASLTGMPGPKEARAEIVKRAESGSGRGGTGPGIKIGGAKARSGIGFDPAMIDLGLEILLYLFVGILFSIVTHAGILKLISELPLLLSSLSPEASQEALQLQQTAAAIRPSTLLLDAAMSGLLLTVSTLVSNGVIYIVGVLFGGAGELFKFIGAVFRVQIIMSILQTVFLGVAASGLFLHAPLGTLLTLAMVGLGLVALSGLGEFIWLVYTVGHAHEVGFIKGFFIVLVGGVVSGILWYLFGIFSA
jgi:hypothetical protein